MNGIFQMLPATEFLSLFLIIGEEVAPWNSTFDFAVPLLIGLGGSVHCIGMCGGIVTALSFGTRESWKWGQIGYHAGRIFTYGILGLILGLVGASMIQSHVIGGARSLLGILSGVVIILYSLEMGDWFPIPLKNPFTFSIPGRLLKEAAAGGSLKAWLTVGVLNGFLPCGLLYSALVYSLSVGNPLGGMGAMLLFGLGTVPSLFLVGALAGKLHPANRLKAQKWMSIILIVLGLILIFRGVYPHSGHPHPA